MVIKFQEEALNQVKMNMDALANDLNDCLGKLPSSVPSGPSGANGDLSSCRNQLKDITEKTKSLSSGIGKALTILDTCERKLFCAEINAIGQTTTVNTKTTQNVISRYSEDKKDFSKIIKQQEKDPISIRFSQMKSKYPTDAKLIAINNAVVVDEFNGVPAIYSKDNETSDIYAPGDRYQCSGYIKAYLEKTYTHNEAGEKVSDVVINDLLYNGCPIYNEKGEQIGSHNGIPNYRFQVDGETKSTYGEMISVSIPKAGDVLSVGDGHHWAIVKEVVGDEVIVIEQNCQSYDKSTETWTAPVNQRYEIKPNKFYRMPGTDYEI